MVQTSVEGTDKLRSRVVGFGLWCAALLTLYILPLSRLIRESLDHGYSSHIVLVPVVAAYLVWSDAHNIFSEVTYSRKSATALCAAAVPVSVVAVALKGNAGLGPLVTVVSVLLWVLAGFAGFFGIKSLRKAIFPALVLLFVIPIPESVVRPVISFLQAQSADLSHWMFKVLGIPVFRDGFVLTLPGARIQVAEECSGINSSIALVILMTVFAHESLKSNWSRVLMILLTIPLSILKNAIRIVTLTTLAVHVDPGFLTGRLHHQGGFVFFLITLALVYPIWKALRWGEKSRRPNATLANAASPSGD